jgi:hypothetical protein
MNFSDLKLYDPSLQYDKITKNTGIYFWFRREDEKLIYIGIALGKQGLYGRIMKQHLNEKYLEFRPEKHTSKDIYQLENSILKKGKNSTEIRKGIDKSTFRKVIGRLFKLKPGDETVKFIKKNFYCKYLESKNLDEIRQLEKDLIQKFNPLFNTTHK